MDVEWTVPCVRITDYPRFQWRGLLIDPARHFIPVREVEKFIDAMALHKFNRLQIHLTDDQGWRIEIKKYPQLTETGAWMDLTTIMERGQTERRRPAARRVLHAGRYPASGPLRRRAIHHHRARDRDARPHGGGDRLATRRSACTRRS